MSRPGRVNPLNAPGARARCILPAAAIVLILCGIALSGCSRRRIPVIGKVGRDPAHVVHRIERDTSRTFRIRSYRQRYQYQAEVPTLPQSRPRSISNSPGSKLHPRLFSLLTGGAPPDSIVNLIVSFRDSVPFPVFPRPSTGEPRTSPGNLLIQHQADSLIGILRGLRATQYGEDSTTLITIPNVTARGRFWIIQAMVVDAPVGSLLTLDSLSNVTYVRPVNGGEPPPNTCPDGETDEYCTDDDETNDIVEGIREIGATDWKTTDYKYGWIGVLDTGVYTDHVLLKDVFASSVELFDCLTDCPTECPDDETKCTECATGNSEDLCGYGHGTSTAGILVGRNSEFPRHEGLTEATLDWYSVHDQDCHGNCERDNPKPTLNACAAVRAFEMNLDRTNPVIIAEVASEGDYRDPIDRAAENAFKSQRVVIAAVGNEPMGDLVLGPAREATVIGVGGRYLYKWVEETDQIPFQRYGTVDGRYKPEILAPTKTEAPARCNDHAFTSYSYTSGATPYAGAAASMLNEWLAKTASVTDAGFTYVQMIAAGSLTGPFTSSKSGVGLLGLSSLASTTWTDKVELVAGIPTLVDLPDAPTDIHRVVAALWWPEPVRSDDSRPHHQVRLELLDADRNPVEISDDANNVFQRLTIDRGKLGPTTRTVLAWRTFTWCWWNWCFSIRFPWIETRSWCLRLTELTTMDPGEIQTVYWTVVGQR